MPGGIAQNLHEGSRSEIVADYLFSTFGTVTPVRRQDDFGIDLYCTLTEIKGQRAVVMDYYSVQVKSTDDAWVFENDENIRWLVEYPTPLFMAVINKQDGVLSVYQTMPRFLIGFWDFPSRLELSPSSSDEGKCAQWSSGTQFSLSAPILRVSIADLLEKEKLARFREVLQFWVAVDRENCTLRRMGLLRFRMPQSYRVNEIPHSGLAEQGNVKPTDEQIDQAILTMADALDCVGNQLLVGGDRGSALYAGLLFNHLRKSRGALFNDELRGWRSDLLCPFEHEIASALNARLYPDRSPQHVLEGLDEVKRQVEESSTFVRFTDD